jgi:ribosomal protein L40E
LDTVTEKSESKKNYRFGKLFCIECGYANTYDSEVCYTCGSMNLTRDKRQIKKKEISEKNPFFRSITFHCLISFVIAVAISFGLIFGIAYKYIIPTPFVAVSIISSSALVLSGFIYVLLRLITKKEIQRERN